MNQTLQGFAGILYAVEDVAGENKNKATFDLDRLDGVKTLARRMPMKWVQLTAKNM